MNVLITAAATPLGQALATGLSGSHQLRLSDRQPLQTEGEFVRSDLGHDEPTNALVADINAIVYLPQPATPDSAGWLDACTRCTYNLLLAAAQAGVGRFIYLSTLDFFLPYDQDMTVSESWRPRPSCAPHTLGPYLGEFIAEEFAHTKQLKLLCLRLGHLVDAGETEGKKYDPMWLEKRDAVQAVAAALEKQDRLPPFAVVHIQSDSQGARFSVARARDWLDYDPQFNFEDNA